MDPFADRLIEFSGNGLVRFALEDDAVLSANRAVLAILGIKASPQDILGRRFNELFRSLENEGVPVGVLAGKGGWRERVFELETLKGARKSLLVDALVEDGAGGGGKTVDMLVRDVTEWVRVREAITCEHNLLRTLVDNLPDVVYFKDAQSRFVVANNAVARLMGAESREALIGKTDFDFYPKELAERYFADEKQVIASGQPIVAREEPCIDTEGNPLWLSTTKEPIIGPDGAVIGIVGVGRDITRHRRVEDALAAALQRFEAVVETTPLVAIQGFDRYGYIRHWNAACTALYGYKREEALGKRLQDILLSGEEAKHFAALLEEIWAAGAATIPAEWEIHTKDGSGRWVYSSIFPVFEKGKVVEAFCMDVDITERKSASDALEKNEAKYRALFEVFPVGLLLEGADGRVVECNGRACELFGYSHDEIRGVRGDALVLSETTGKPLPVGAFARSEGIRKSGTTFAAEVLRQPVEISGEAMLLTSVRDVMDAQPAGGHLRPSEQQAHFSQKLESLGRLAGGIAHDFNNLLTGMLGHASLALLELPPASPARENVKQVESAARRAAELAKQMLVYSGKGRFVVQPVQISDAVKEMANLFKVSVSKRCGLKYSLAGDLPGINADISELRQVVMNLIVNASDAIGKNDGEIIVSTGQVECDARALEEAYVNENLPEGVYVYVEVADTGCGMTPEVQARMFDPFFTTKPTGRGLGLAVVVGIVRGHKGCIKVSSEPGRGSSFRVLFPAAKAAAVGAPEEENIEVVYRGTGTVLVVDDEDVVRELAREALEDAGFDVLLVCDGREALEIYKAHADEIRAVVLDLTMPHLDGVETFEAMKAIRGDVRVVLSSGHSEQDAMNRFEGKGLSGFIHKPYCATDLARLVCNVIAGGPEEAARGLTPAAEPVRKKQNREK